MLKQDQLENIQDILSGTPAGLESNIDAIKVPWFIKCNPHILQEIL
ncbi:MAG: hypothetical protein JRJ31_14580 [Deltaproteobacteria bacterium]|nr:hypothetical protein [Deltaproteobacteria bacterium]